MVTKARCFRAGIRQAEVNPNGVDLGAVSVVLSIAVVSRYRPVVVAELWHLYRHDVSKFLLDPC